VQLKYKKQSGIGLIETLLALGVGIIVITAMVSLAVFTLRASIQNKLTLAGTQLANQEIELIRAFRDSQSWSEFIEDIDGTTGTDCFVDENPGGPCYMVGLNMVPGELIIDEGKPTELKKSFTITDQDPPGDESLVRVAVSVTWKIGSDTKSTHNYTELSNWRQR
jgi:hypothetical protein